MRSGLCRSETAKLTRLCWPPLKVPTVRVEGGRSSKPDRKSSFNRTWEVANSDYLYLYLNYGSHLLTPQTMQSSKIL